MDGKDGNICAHVAVIDFGIVLFSSLGYRIYFDGYVSYSRVVANQTVSNLVTLACSHGLTFELGSDMGGVLLLVFFSVLFVEGVVEDFTVFADGEAWVRVDREAQGHLHPLFSWAFPLFPFFPYSLPSGSRWSVRYVG